MSGTGLESGTHHHHRILKVARERLLHGLGATALVLALTALPDSGASAATGTHSSASGIGDPRASADAASPMLAQAARSRNERRLMMLVAALKGADEQARQEIVDELTTYGEAAIEMIVTFHEDGHFEDREMARLVKDIRVATREASPSQKSDGPSEAPVEAAASDAEVRYRVTGLADDAMLNVRAGPDPSATVVGMLFPGAMDLERSGQEDEDPDGNTWWELLDPQFPDGRGWVNADFLEPVGPAQAERTASEPSERPLYRVDGVAQNVVLNVRQSAGTSGMTIGMLRPNAGGIQLSGEQKQIGDNTWVEITDASLPGGRGWVNAGFLAPETPETKPDPQEDSLVAKAQEFVHAEGYAVQDAQQLEESLQAVLTGNPQSALAPGNEIGPLTKAVLALDAAEGNLRHARYHLRYGMMMVEAPPAADPIPMSLVTIDRYNLGPQMRAGLVAAHGEDNVAPPEHFGTGPHVSYRLAMRPIMGRTADIVAASRTELAAPSQPCLGYHCLIPQGTGDHVADWSEMAPFDPPDFQTAYEETRNGALSPAAALDVLTVEMGLARVSNGHYSWNGFEPRESVAPGEPFAEAVIELNFGQDQSVDILLRDGNLMDHAIEAVWQRVTSIASGSDAPLVYSADAVEHRPGQN